MTIDAEALFRQLGITCLIPIPRKPESDLFAKALDKQLGILDAIDWQNLKDTAPWKGAWCKFVGFDIQITFKHRNKVIFGTYQVIGGFEQLRQALVILKDAARDTNELEPFLAQTEHQPNKPALNDDDYIFGLTDEQALQLRYSLGESSRIEAIDIAVEFFDADIDDEVTQAADVLDIPDEEPEPDISEIFFEASIKDEADEEGCDNWEKPVKLDKYKKRKKSKDEPTPEPLKFADNLTGLPHPEFAKNPVRLIPYVGGKAALMYNIQELLPRRQFPDSKKDPVQETYTFNVRSVIKTRFGSLSPFTRQPRLNSDTICVESKTVTVNHLPPTRRRLIEPFVGSAAVFMNFAYKRLYDEYICADCNADLINLFNLVKNKDGYEYLVSQCEKLFVEENQTKEVYIRLRDEMNALKPDQLNPQSLNEDNEEGGFSVGWGSRKFRGVPLQILKNFHELSASSRVTFVKGSYKDIIKMAELGDTVYSDPPYKLNPGKVPHKQYLYKFSDCDHLKLVELAKKCREEGIATLISNNDNPTTRLWYEDADVKEYVAMRSYNAKKKGAVDGEEKPVVKRYEVLALYDRLIDRREFNVRKSTRLYRYNDEKYDEARESWNNLNKSVAKE